MKKRKNLTILLNKLSAKSLKPGTIVRCMRKERPGHGIFEGGLFEISETSMQFVKIKGSNERHFATRFRAETQ